MSTLYFETYADVVERMSGMEDWDWGDESMNFDGFCDFVWENHDRKQYDQIENEHDQIAALLAGYCMQEGGNLSDWCIRYNGDVEQAAKQYLNNAEEDAE